MRYAGVALIAGGALAGLLQLAGWLPTTGALTIVFILGLPCVGAFVLFVGRALAREPGIDNDNIYHQPLTARGIPAIVLGVLLTGFYIVIYFGTSIKMPDGGHLHAWATTNVYSVFEPISQALRGTPSDNWFTYSLLYTFAIVVFGVRFLLKYRHNRYQQFRTLSVMFFQLGFGFLIPGLLVLFKRPEYYFSYFWPLKPEYLFPVKWSQAAGGSAGLYFLSFGAAMTFIGTPTLTYFFGKRWYCSWVCGCGGLAETMGDPFRQLSDKSVKAWKLERWIIHGVLALIVAVTALLWINSFTQGRVLGRASSVAADLYGFYIGMIFSGVVGVGFYPLMGSRVWCRFGCPMAAILGILQKFFSRFRITTNGAQCISCGNCSTYCEMGIDVRWYAQRQQNIVRASCVGCGVCAAVCPRGVLRLENGPVRGRTDDWHLKDLVEGRIEVGALGQAVR